MSGPLSRASSPYEVSIALIPASGAVAEHARARFHFPSLPSLRRFPAPSLGNREYGPIVVQN